MKSILLTISIFILSFQISDAQWVKVSNGIGDIIINKLACSGNNVFAGTHSGVYLSTNNGSSWIYTSMNTYVWPIAINGSYIFVGSYINNGVYLSTNNGTTWTQTSLNNRSVRSLAINGNNVLAGTYTYGVYLSTNNGATWTQTTLNNQSVLSLAVNINTVFAGTDGYGVYLSTNNGTSWTQTSLNNRTIWSLAVIGNNIFAGTDGNGVYLSTNNSTSWTQTSLNNQRVFSLHVNGNNIFAGSSGNGIYVSNNNGVSWTQRNEGLGNLVVNAFCILNNYIFAGTLYSVYRRPLGELVSIKPISNEVPKSYSLFQNYPNPFNPTTKIKFGIPTAGEKHAIDVHIIIYDVSGRLIETIVNENLKPGIYEVTWNASKYSSGVYFYKLVSVDYVNAKKMILIK